VLEERMDCARCRHLEPGPGQATRRLSGRSWLMGELDRSHRHRLTFNLLLPVALGGIWPITDWPGAAAGSKFYPDHSCHLSSNRSYSACNRQLADTTDPKATKMEMIDLADHPVSSWSVGYHPMLLRSSNLFAPRQRARKQDWKPRDKSGGLFNERRTGRPGNKKGPGRGRTRGL